jgi:Fe-Mn family superoxide dismutase
MRASRGLYSVPVPVQTMAPGGSAPSPRMASLITDAFGSFDTFKSQLSASAAGVFGSGWSWLAVDPSNKSLSVQPSNNQDNPLMTGLGYSGAIPILGVDVWEHVRPPRSTPVLTL